MAESENIIVNVQLNFEALEDRLTGLLNGMGTLKTSVSNMLMTITKGFSSNLSQLRIVETSNRIGFSDVVDALNNINAVINELINAQAEDSLLNLSLKPIDWMLQIAGIGASMGTGGNNPNMNAGSFGKESVSGKAPWDSNTPILLLTDGKESQKSSGSASSGVSNIVSSAMGATGGLLSDGMSTDTMSAGMDTVIGKLQETTKAWAAQTAAKVADLAEDANIIAMNTVEHAKAFGSMVVQMAKTTAAWVAETAAKIASTAAQWAQNAATTAWQAICVAATAVTTAFGAAVAFLTSPIGIVIVAITALIAIVVLLVQNWDTVKATAIAVWEAIQSALGTAAQWFNTNVIQPVVKFFGDMWTGICDFAKGAWDGIVEVFSAVATWFDQNVVQPVAEFFSGLWDGICDTAQTAWDGIVAVIKEPLNSIIGFINGLVSGVVSGVNTIIRALNGLSFTVPDWVPVLGGSSFGFNIRTLTAPQIPYLAKGAVLPANRPFLAVVGDQRHGTNIEAPLTTIQEAVAVVMQEHISAMMAGFQALLDEQRATRRTIEGIEIGDSVIGQAAERYNSKMAVARGVWY